MFRNVIRMISLQSIDDMLDRTFNAKSAVDFVERARNKDARALLPDQKNGSYVVAKGKREWIVSYLWLYIRCRNSFDNVSR